MRLLSNNKHVSIPAVIYAILGCILWMAPLLNVLHAESSAVIAGVSFFVAGLYSLRPLSKLTPFVNVLLLQLLLLLIPWLMLSISLLWQHNCGYGQGVLFYLLFSLPAVILAVSFSYLLVYSRFKKKKTIFVTTAILFGLGGIVFDLGFHSQFFTYNHIFGGILGPIYDEELFIREGLLAFRGRTFLLAGLCWIAAEALRVKATPRLKMGGVIVLALLVLSYLFAAQLRINTPAWFIKQHLQGHAVTEHFDVYYDDTSLDSAAVSNLVDEHEYRYQFIRRQLKIDVDQRIQSFIYPDPETKDWLTGSRNTSVTPVWLSEPQMHILIDVFDRVFPHELGHVFSREFGLPIINASLSVGLVEGLAVSLEPADGRPLPHEQVLTAVSMETSPNKSIDIKETIGLAARFSPLGFWTGRGAVSYTTMGSFVQFLAEEYGYEQVMKTYAQSNFETVFGKSVQELEAEWETHLKGLQQVDRATHNYVTRRFSIPSLFEKRCPHHLPAHERNFRAGVEALSVGDTLDALTQFESALRVAPAFEEALSAWAAIKINQQATDPVISKINDTFVGTNEQPGPPSSAGIWVQLGDALALAGDSVKARAAYDSALVRLPIYAHQQRGLIALRALLAGETEVQQLNRSSKSVFDKVAGLDMLQAGNPNVSVLQALLWVTEEKYEPALAYLEQYNTTFQPDPDEAIHRLTRILNAHLQYRLGNLQLALEEARVIEKDFKDKGAYNSANQYADFADKMSYIIQQKGN